MKKQLVLLVTLCACVHAFSQLPVWQGEFAFSDDTTKPRDYFKVVSEYTVNSNSLSNEFMNGMGSGDEISEENKEQELVNLKNKLRIGIVLDASVWYKHRVKKHTINLVFALRGRSFRAIELGKDVVELALNGNTAYQGEEKKLSPASLLNYIHQEVYVGAEKVFNQHGLMIGGGLTLQKLSTYTSLAIEKGSLYTAPDGRYVDFEIQYQSEETRSVSSNNLKRFEGWGTTLNVYAHKQFNNKNSLAFEIRDVGFIYMSDKKTNSLDTTGRWSGVEVEDINSFNSNSSSTNVDDLLNKNEERKAGRLITTGSVNLSYYHQLNAKLEGYIGVKQYFTSAYLPRIYVRPYYKVHHYLSVGVPVAYGGFGRFDLGLSVKGNILKNYYYTVDVNYLESLLNPKNSSGQGFNFGLSAMF